MKIGSCAMGDKDIDIHIEWVEKWCDLHFDTGRLCSERYANTGLALKAITDEFGDSENFTWRMGGIGTTVTSIGDTNLINNQTKIGSCTLDGKAVDIYIEDMKDYYKVGFDIDDVDTGTFSSTGEAIKTIIREFGNNPNFRWKLSNVNILELE